MWNFLVENAVAIVFGILTAIFSAITLRYKIREHRHRIEGIVDENRLVTLYLTRDATLQGLRDMYNAATAGDTLWGQCVGCRAYPDDVTQLVMEAAQRGVRFRFIINTSATTAAELRRFFGQLRAAETRERSDNVLRIQGLSKKQVVIALPGMDSYTAIRVRNRHFVELFYEYFQGRWESANDQSIPVGNE